MAEIIHAKDLRAGHTILIGNDIFRVVDNSFNKTCMAKAIVNCTVKNLRTGSTLKDKRMDEDKYERVDVVQVPVSFSYIDGDNYVFMDETTYETIELPKTRLGNDANFINEGVQVKLTKYGEEILGVTLPDQVVMAIKETEEAPKNSGATARMKKAVLENGVEIEVPEFIKIGEKVTISTMDGKYVGRAAK